MERHSSCLPTVTGWIQNSLISLLSAGLLLMLPVAGAGAELYVSPDGNDSDPGTQTQPLRTLQGARDRLRSIDKGTESCVVLFQAGDYVIDNTVHFGREDSGVAGSPVIYKNRDALGSARFVGGRALTAWKDEGDGIYSAEVEGNIYALFENDQPAVMAREPDAGYAFFESVTDYSHLTYKAADFGRFDYQGAAVRLWAHWIPAKIAIQSVDFQTRTITLDQSYAGNMKGTLWEDNAWAAKTPTRFYIHNSRTFLDQPGEFYMDQAARRLYYKPRQAPIDKQTILAPTVDRLIDIDGASDIQFEGLTFSISNGLLEVKPSLALHSNVRGGLVHLGKARNIVLRYCRFVNSGQNGVVVEGDIEKCTMYGNLFTRIMSGGVRFVGGNNRDNIIENNYVHHVGEGIYIRNSTGDVIRHNRIHDVESNGFKLLYGERQIISYNDISRIGQDGTDSDAGGIYVNCTAGGPEGGHVTIDHNLLHDMTNNGYPGYPAAAIYLDMDGVFNCTLSNNIIYNIIQKYGIHFRGTSHVIRNNIIDFEGSDLLACVIASPGRFPKGVNREQFMFNQGYTLEHNIIWSPSGAIYRITHRPDEDSFRQVDNNVYYNPNGEYSFGKIKGEEVTGIWQGLGLDAHTQHTDPLFMDRANHDYHLQPRSPARALGFQDIDTSEIGLMEDFPYKGGE